MKRAVPVPVAIGIAAGAIVGFFLGAMVTRHGEPAVVIRNATDETLQRVSVTTDIGESYSIRDCSHTKHQLCECRTSQWR